MLGFTLLIYAVAFFISAIYPHCAVLTYASVCVFHEFGHYFAGRCYIKSMNAPRLKVLSFVLDVDSPNDASSYIIAMSGPAMNLLSGCFALMLFGDLFYSFSLISFWVALFNLLPVFSLDGYVAVRSILSGLDPHGRAVNAFEILSDILTLAICSVTVFRMLKFGDSIFAFAFFIKLFYSKHGFSKHRKYDLESKNS